MEIRRARLKFYCDLPGLNKILQALRTRITTRQDIYCTFIICINTINMTSLEKLF